MLSIVNPVVERNGASTLTRGLLKLLTLPPFQAHLEFIPVRSEPVHWRRLAQARGLVLGSLSNTPAKASFLYSKEFRNKVVARVQDERFDLVIVNGADLLWISEYLPKSMPRILVAHNIEHRLFRTQIQNLSWLYRPLEVLLRADCRRLEEYELKGMRESRNVIFLSEDEAIYARGVCAGLHSITLPPVFDYEPAMRQPKKPGPILEIGLLGNFLWWPNQLGLRWFAHEVLPHVKSPMRLSLFGRSASRGWRRDPRIVERGMVESIQQVWESCHFMICPSFSTGGVCVKLAEAAYNGMPVLATSHAGRGLPLGEDPALVFLDEPGAWIEFLNSAAAWQLAERQVSGKTCARLAIGAQKDPFQQFVMNAIASGTAPGACS